MKKLLFIFLVAACSAACATDPSDGVSPTARAVLPSGQDELAVSLDEALDEMYEVMNAVYGTATRSVGRKTVADVGTYKTSGIATRSGGASASTALAYVVNFEEGGFAVLGARRTVPSVLCITEEGLFDNGEVQELAREIVADEASENTPRWMSYEEMHRSNPDNAGVLFDITDYNADLDEDQTEAGADEGEYLIASTDAPRFIKKELLSYVRNSSSRAIEVSSTKKALHRRYYGSKQAVATIPETGPATIYGDWEDFAKVGPFLSTLWNQTYPYNMYCPADPTDHSRISYTGCVATALSQVIAFNEKPSPSTIDGSVTSTWTEIKEHYHNPSKTAVRTAAQVRIESDMAKIVRAIGKGVNMDYSYFNGSAASSAAAKRYLKQGQYNIKYNKVRKKNRYKSDHIALMLGRGLPIYISAAGNGGAHAWVLDGEVSQRRQIDTYNDAVLTGSKTESRTMIHCNFGWGGTANGYYFAEVFDPSSGPVDTEQGVDAVNPSSNGRLYNREYQIIQYER